MRYTPPKNTIERDIQDGARFETDRISYASYRPFGVPKRIVGNNTIGYGQIALCDPTAAALTITLPQASREKVGQLVIVKNNTDSTNAITIRPSGSEQIDGESSLELSTARAVALLMCDYEEWVRL